MNRNSGLSSLFLAASLAAAVLVSPDASRAEDPASAAMEKEYTLLAGRVIATADACTELKVIDPGVGFLDEIEVAMLGFGAAPEEVEEWMSSVVARKSPAIQAILRSESEEAMWLECTKELDDNRRKLAAILNGDAEDEGSDAPSEPPKAE